MGGWETIGQRVLSQAHYVNLLALTQEAIVMLSAEKQMEGKEQEERMEGTNE